MCEYCNQFKDWSVEQEIAEKVLYDNYDIKQRELPLASKELDLGKAELQKKT